jgi:exopolysaccharide biosynthesis polyprenyl glycosylphosphotransferase
MLKQHPQFFGAGYMLVEILTWVGAFWCAREARVFLGAQFPEIFSAGVASPAVLLPLAVGVWVLAARWMGLHRSRRMIRAMRDVGDLSRAMALTFVALVTLTYVFQLPTPSRAFLMLFCATALAGLVVTRLSVRGILARARANGYNSRNLIIVGSGEGVVSAHDWVSSHRDWGLEFVGFVSTSAWRPQRADLGTAAELQQVLTEHVIDEVLFVPDPDRPEVTDDAMRVCREMGVGTRMLMDFVPPDASTSSVFRVDGHSVLDLSPPPSYVAGMIVKRGFDILIAGAALAVTAPILLTVAALVKTTSEGPIFFAQERVGKNGRTFKMLKFRSMVVNAEALRAKLEAENEMDGPVFKIKRDPRITRIGHFIRKTSLDEFPQFINVMRGEMSIVGPRPPLPSEVEQYERWQRKRLSVKPGITCIWQISGRNDVTFEQWVQMDIDYIDRWSLWLDVKIFLKTIPAVLLRRGAS